MNLYNISRKQHNLLKQCLAIIFILLTFSPTSQATKITGFSPEGGPAGTLVTIEGNDFSNAHTVLFKSGFGIMLFPDFSIVSDTVIHAVAPINPWGHVFPLTNFLVASPQEAFATVLQSQIISVESELPFGAGGRILFIEDGGFLNGMGGANLVYIKTGGEATNYGSGVNYYFVEPGGTANILGGGGNVVFHEPGAILNISDNVNVAVHEVDQVTIDIVDDLFDYSVAPPNNPPVADAGVDQNVVELGTLITLDGIGSYDSDGTVVNYHWEFVSKPATSTAALDNSSIATPSFVADVQGDYVISLVVTDDKGALSASVTVLVSFSNLAPVADAGDNQAGVVGNVIYLDGSGSTDANLDPLTYTWSIIIKPDESLTGLTSFNTVATDFVADIPGVYIVSLVVNDGQLDSSPSHVTITVISQLDALTQEIMRSIEILNSFDADVFKNKNLHRILAIKLSVVLKQVDEEDYQGALVKLQNDIIPMVDGCSVAGAPDKNDWVIDCVAQDQLFTIFKNLENLLSNYSA